MTSEKRVALPFTCPTCGHENRYPKAGQTEGGTPMVVCGECGQQVSQNVVRHGDVPALGQEDQPR